MNPLIIRSRSYPHSIFSRENRPRGSKKETAKCLEKPTLLIVDDEERNIRLLKAMLMAKNYHLLEASRGEEALRIVSATPPDMILLDVMMPQMDGFEVCRRLKGDEKTRKIPVILVTALSEKQHRVKAMEVGADDFLSKPVDLTELTVRVKSLLRIKSYHDELFNSYQEIAAKNEKLEELQKAKEGLTHMIIHDLRNPLTAISTYLQLALMEKKDFSEGQQIENESVFLFLQRIGSADPEPPGHQQNGGKEDAASVGKYQS